MDEDTEQPAGDSSSQQPERLRATLLASPEGRILLIGAALAFAYIFWLGVKLLLSPDEFQVLTGMTAMNIMFGRAAAMAFGYSLGLEHAKVIPICMTIETILVLIVYPLFVFSWRHLLVIKGLKNIFDRIHKSAEARKDKVQKYGLIGLFAFVWFPFWMTGPVVGCVIGFLLGLRSWLNITVVLSGTYLAILAWAFFLRRFRDSVAAYSSQAAMVLMVLLIVIIIAGSLMHRTLHENKDKD
ncbi:MAG: small multi-drug export protein [Planctomycetota bacterium]|jgi:uncharacterized membrane protein